MEGKSTNWQDGESATATATAEPGVSVAALAEGLPTLTAATILAVALVVLLTIAVVFGLGVLIDCRQQRLLDKKMGEMKRARSRRSPAHPQQGDGVCIVDHMEETAVSAPPDAAAAALRDVP